MRRITIEAIEKIKEFEGLRLEAYQCSAGKWTIGYGHTNNVTPGMKITQSEAEELLIRDLFKHEERVARLVTVPLTDNQFAALVSFDFNTGALHSSTLLKKLNAGDYEAVPIELMKWVKTTDPKTKKKTTVQGLVNRRAAEAGMWAKGAFVASNNVEALPDKPPFVDKETVSWGAGIMATLASGITGDGPIQWVIAGAIAVAFSAGAYFFIQRRKA